MSIKLSQHQKVINLCNDGLWHCQNEFRALFIYSPHKRRFEVETEDRFGHRYKFIRQKCEHGILRQFDYKMIEKQLRINPYDTFTKDYDTFTKFEEGHSLECPEYKEVSWKEHRISCSVLGCLNLVPKGIFALGSKCNKHYFEQEEKLSL